MSSLLVGLTAKAVQSTRSCLAQFVTRTTGGYFALRVKIDRSGLAYFLWRTFRRSRHPRRYRGFFGLLFDVPVPVVALIFVLLHLSLALVSVPLYDLIFMGNPRADPGSVSTIDHIIYSLINQISPGFTEFLPADRFGRIIAAGQAFLGLFINVLFLSTIFSRAVHPRGVFEVSPFMLHSPAKNRFIFRLYSKYPEPIHNLEFRFFRFLMHETDNGQILGRSEEIIIYPNLRQYVRPYYALLLNVGIDSIEKDWNLIADDGYKYPSIPSNWFVHDESKRGHYYLIISADTSSGPARQVVDFYFSDKHMVCGDHAYMNDGLQLSMADWYDYRRYRWDTWNQVRPADCSKCQMTRCIYKGVSD